MQFVPRSGGLPRGRLRGGVAMVTGGVGLGSGGAAGGVFGGMSGGGARKGAVLASRGNFVYRVVPE